MLQYNNFFAIIVMWVCYNRKKNCYDVSGEVFVDVSSDVDFATITHFCCYEISGEVSGEVSLFFFYFVNEQYFATWSKNGLLFATWSKSGI